MANAIVPIRRAKNAGMRTTLMVVRKGSWPTTIAVVTTERTSHHG